MHPCLSALGSAILVLLISTAFQGAVYPRPFEDTNLSQLITPDSRSYMRVARFLPDEDASNYLRTPGLPLCIRMVAWWNGIDFDSALIPGRNWEDVSDDGKRVIRATLQIYHFLGVLLPVVIYGMVLILCGIPWLAVLASFAYMVDIGSVCSQSVLMTELPAMFWSWVSLAATACLFRRPSPATGCLAGLIAGLAAWMRPDCLLLGVWVCALLVLMFWWNRNVFPWRRAVLVYSAFSLVFASLVGACCLQNRLVTGHFFYSLGVAFTKQSIAVKTIAEAPDITNDPELGTLQRHYRATLKSGAKNGWIPWSSYRKVAGELGCDQYHYRKLVARALSAAFWMNPREFLDYARNNYWMAWRNPYNAFNPEARQNAAASPVFRNFCRLDGRMVFGEWTHTAFILAWFLSFLMLRRAWQRFLLLYMALQVFFTFVVCAAIDEDAPLRHTMMVRTWVNAQCLLGVGLAIQLAASSLRRFAGPSVAPLPLPMESQTTVASPIVPNLFRSLKRVVTASRRSRITAMLLLCLALAGGMGLGLASCTHARLQEDYRSVARLLSSGAAAGDVVVHYAPQCPPDGEWKGRSRALLDSALQPEWIVAPSLKGKLHQFGANSAETVEAFARQYPNATLWVLQDSRACTGTQAGGCAAFSEALTRRHGAPAVYRMLSLWRVDEPTVNLIDDGGFEKGEAAATLSGQGGVVTGAEEACEGQHALRFKGTGNARLCFPVLPPPGPDAPKTFTLSMMVRYENIVSRPSSSGETAKVVIAAFDERGHLSRNEQGSPLKWRSCAVFSGTRDEWHRIVITLDREADLSPSSAQNCVVLGNFGGTGTIWFDNVQFETKDHATKFVDGERAAWVNAPQASPESPVGESRLDSK